MAAMKGPVHVRPQWVVDSIRAGKKLKEVDYILAQGVGGTMDDFLN
jgi:hypothetical protein